MHTCEGSNVERLHPFMQDRVANTTFPPGVCRGCEWAVAEGGLALGRYRSRTTHNKFEGQLTGLGALRGVGQLTEDLFGGKATLHLGELGDSREAKELAELVAIDPDD